jgi:diacylglycerol kinase
MFNRIRAHHVSFRHAFDGLKYTLSSQPNFRFHLLATALVTLLGIYFSISTIEWLVLIFTVNLVLVAEMVNTSIESMVDLITLERRQDAKTAKDVSAGMVLVSAFFSVAIGLFIFLPKIINSLS